LDKVQCEILGLSSSSSTGGAFALVLKEVNGNRRLPIIIGSFEAQAIALEIDGYKPQRPLTHDLLKNVIDSLGGSIIEVIIDELKENTFYSKIILEVSAITNEIDSRPSDAIALAVRTQAPIYVSESVMKIASFIPASESEKEIFNSESEEEETKTSDSKEAKIAELQNKLKEAIEAEEYELAAKLRDDIQKLTNNN
jgi:bifunctional DNase/RNase